MNLVRPIHARSGEDYLVDSADILDSGGDFFFRTNRDCKLPLVLRQIDQVADYVHPFRRNSAVLATTRHSQLTPGMTISGRMQASVIHAFWSLVTRIGTRRMGNVLKAWYPSAYGDSIFYFEYDKGAADDQCIALTIDDGLVRGKNANDGPQSSSASMVHAVCELLRTHQARATFFVCTDYTTDKEQAKLILDEGHELGNHLKEDKSGYYCNLSEDDFRTELDESNKLLWKVVSRGDDDDDNVPRIAWFRAPQGIMSQAMCRVLREQTMKNIMGDCYCDDWAFAEKVGSTSQVVAPLMLKQVQAGSIAIFHMPQRGFRETTLDAMREFLEGIQQRKLKCVTVSEMMNQQVGKQR